ncbi:CHRD domain-containing protein [Massilia sp. LXY-6]|uniref:CHRD domain-containing protein n=1 Tax=Massilia sp. LXY-6 TaxID=3379823 RepID=UPI003EE3CBDF
MKHVLSVLALAAAGLAPPAFAQTYRAVASGPAESPPNGSPGDSLVTIDLNTSKVMVDMPFHDLVGTSSAAHIHCCTSTAFTGTAPIAMPFDGFPTGVHAGDYTRAIPLYEETSYTPAFLAAHGGTASGAASALVNAINANEAYINIHTSAYPNGEIRGFLVAAPVPEPGEWAMLAGGLASLLWAGRRRRPESIWQK